MKEVKHFNICGTCSSFIKGQKMGKRCKDGFVTGTYPDGIPNCQKEEAPYWLMPPYQWEALTMGRVKQ